MYQISLESLKKMVEMNNLLNQVEIRGISNIGFLYKSLLLLQEILTDIENNNNSGISIDNTKEGG